MPFLGNPQTFLQAVNNRAHGEAIRTIGADSGALLRELSRQVSEYGSLSSEERVPVDRQVSPNEDAAPAIGELEHLNRKRVDRFRQSLASDREVFDLGLVLGRDCPSARGTAVHP